MENIDKAEKSKEKMSYESAISRMEEILKSLEIGNNKLEDSLKLYEEGIKLYRYCNEVLNEAELKVTQFNQEKEEVEVEI